VAFAILVMLALGGLCYASWRLGPGQQRQQWFIGGSLGAFLFIAVSMMVVTNEGIAEWDGQITQWADAIVPDKLATFFVGVGVAGSTLVLAPLIGTGASILWWKGQRQQALQLLTCTILTSLMIPLMKIVFARERPELAIVHITGLSFPSGHTAAAAALAAWLVHFSDVLAKRRLVAISLVAAAFLWLALVAISRLGLRVHYLSDVLGGAGLGIAVAGFTLAASWPNVASKVTKPTHGERE
jgi:undecaprenyl-diphosphatase